MPHVFFFSDFTGHFRSTNLMMYGSLLLSCVGAFIPRYAATIFPNIVCYHDVKLPKHVDVFFNIFYCMLLLLYLSVYMYLWAKFFTKIAKPNYKYNKILFQCVENVKYPLEAQNYQPCYLTTKNCTLIDSQSLSDSKQFFIKYNQVRRE